jgi:hypothetical protein
MAFAFVLPRSSRISIVALGAVFVAARKILRIWRSHRDCNPEFKISAMLGVLASGLAGKLILILLLLVVQYPVRRATSYMQQTGFFGSNIASLVNNAVPLLALFMLINFINALPEPDGEGRFTGMNRKR